MGREGVELLILGGILGQRQLVQPRRQVLKAPLAGDLGRRVAGAIREVNPRPAVLDQGPSGEAVAARGRPVQRCHAFVVGRVAIRLRFREEEHAEVVVTALGGPMKRCPSGLCFAVERKAGDYDGRQCRGGGESGNKASGRVRFALKQEQAKARSVPAPTKSEALGVSRMAMQPTTTKVTPCSLTPPASYWWMLFLLGVTPSSSLLTYARTFEVG